MKTEDQLRELANNLYWTWQPEIISVFRDLDPELWRRVNHNPLEFLAQFPPEKLEKRATELALASRISNAFHQLRRYLEAKRTWGLLNAPILNAHPVVYFSAEFGLHESLPIYSGGLGVLAGDHLKSASDLGVPLIGVGLFYAQGYFNQQLDSNGWQKESYQLTKENPLPVLRATDSEGKPLVVSVQTRDSEIKIAVWTIQVGRNRLVLLDSDMPDNSEADQLLTSTLYGGDQTVRIRQELILGVGGMRAIRAIGIEPGVIHLNEGHTVFALLEQAKHVMTQESRSFHDVFEKVARMAVFTTHTPVPAGHDRFNPELVEKTLGPVRESLGLSEHDFLGLGRVHTNNHQETFCMTVLGLKMSRSRNGVSAIHGHVSRRMWKDLWPHTPQVQIPIGHITNGVHLASWLAPEMYRLYDRCLRTHWQDQLCYRETWEPVVTIDTEEFWEVRQLIKVHLVNYVARQLRRQDEQRGDSPASKWDYHLNPTVLTIGFARRFATYKRGNLLFTDLDRLDRIINNSKSPMQIIFAGKAHPADELGKQLIQNIHTASKDPRFIGKIVFLEDYDINVARHMVQGVDLWLNNPQRPLEACGTSGEKVVMNGGLNLAILDGWWAEAYDGSNGFAIGNGLEHSDHGKQAELDAVSLYETLENYVIPLYYSRNGNAVPSDWVERQKRAIQSLAWRFNADRMVMQYTTGCYLQAIEGLSCQLP